MPRNFGKGLAVPGDQLGVQAATCPQKMAQGGSECEANGRGFSGSITVLMQKSRVNMGTVNNTKLFEGSA